MKTLISASAALSLLAGAVWTVAAGSRRAATAARVAMIMMS